MSDPSGPKPRIPYWHLWTDADGVSHQQQCALTEFELKGVGGAAPQWNNKHERTEATVVVTVQPVGWVGTWHRAVQRCWLAVTGSALQHLRGEVRRLIARGIPEPADV